MGNFDWSIILGPIVGAVIGYCTNFIAVKMLFRPLHEVKIGNFKLPFTPGMIPKEKSRLAKAVGEAVGDTLLTEETLSETLLDQQMKNKIGAEVTAFVDGLKRDETKITDKLETIIPQENIAHNINNIKAAVTDKLYGKIVDMKLGKTVSEQVMSAVKSKLEGGLFAMMLNDTMLESFMEPVSDMIDGYVVKNGREVIEDKVSVEIDSLADKSVGELTAYMDVTGIDIATAAINIYENFVKTGLKKVLNGINISRVIENKINEMNVSDLEELIMSVMKKELNAIVNLGALIGFILGIIMIFV